MARDKGDYCFDDVVAALRAVNVCEGATIYSHVGLLKLGIPAEIYAGALAFDVIYNAIIHVLGPRGTFLTPTYSYSFCNGEIYSPQKSPSKVGPFGNMFLIKKAVFRSLDPIFSVAGFGPRAEELLSSLPNDSFGRDSVYQRFEDLDVTLCNIGVDLFFSTSIHHIEQTHGVPHRFLKIFSGTIDDGVKSWKTRWIYNVRVLGRFSFPRFDRLQDEVLQRGVCRKADLGLGTIHSVSARDYYAAARDMLNVNPMCFAENPMASPEEETKKNRKQKTFPIKLSSDSSMQSIIKEIAMLPRDIVSDGYDAAIELLAAIVPMTIHQYPTGKEYFTWIAPEKWTCKDAYVETMDGKRLFSYTDHPLHVVSYSLPIDMVVSREILFEHIYTHPHILGAIPFKFKYYERDWGFCCSQIQKESMQDKEYRVKIDSEFSYGAVRVGEVLARGISKKSFIFCAHLCHPAQVNDDLSGVAAGIEVMRNLLQRTDLKYTYRLLILPESIGSAAWLSSNERLIPDIFGGIFLEMLARNAPHALQCSFSGETQVDKVCRCALKEIDDKSWHAPFMQIILNDERMFNSPGIDVPMLSLSRCLPKSHQDYPFKEYHTDKDNIENSDIDALHRSVDAILMIVSALENNCIPKRKYLGEIHCSRYAKIDYTSMYRYVHTIPYYINGERSIADIALECRFGFFETYKFLKVMESEGLVEFIDFEE